jgi:hypothetical protein
MIGYSHTNGEMRKMARLQQIGNDFYLDRVEHRVATTDFYVTVIVHTFVIVTPFILAMFFGLGFLAFYIMSCFILLMFWAIVDDSGGLDPFKIKTKSYSRMVHYTDGKVGDLVRAIIELSRFEKELATLVTPSSLYEEVMDKVENYARLAHINAENSLKLDSYIKNIKTLTKECKNIRTNNLTEDNQVLKSALTIAGINQEED